MSEKLPKVIYVSASDHGSRRYHTTNHISSPLEKITDISSIRTLLNKLGYVPCEICKNREINEEFKEEVKELLDHLSGLDKSAPEGTVVRVYQKRSTGPGSYKYYKIWEQEW